LLQRLLAPDDPDLPIIDLDAVDKRA